MFDGRIGLAELTREIGEILQRKLGGEAARGLIGVDAAACSLVKEQAEIADELAIELARILSVLDRGIDEFKRGVGVAISQCLNQ